MGSGGSYGKFETQQQTVVLSWSLWHESWGLNKHSGDVTTVGSSSWKNDKPFKIIKIVKYRMTIIIFLYSAPLPVVMDYLLITWSYSSKYKFKYQHSNWRLTQSWSSIFILNLWNKSWATDLNYSEHGWGWRRTLSDISTLWQVPCPHDRTCVQHCPTLTGSHRDK